MGSTTKTDMERIGLFKEMEYATIKDPYKDSSKFQFNESAYRNKQMLSKGSKQRSTGSMSGYFDQEYKILPASYIDPISLRRRARLQEKKKNIVSKPFVSMFRARDPEGLGSFFGTIGGAVKDPEPNKPKYREKPKPSSEKPNVKTRPPKKGSGYGFPHLGIEKDPSYTYKNIPNSYDAPVEAQRKEAAAHKAATKAGVFKLNMHPKEFFDRNPFREEGKPRSRSEETPRSQSAPTDKKPFKYSSPGKSLGGNKDGCFDKFPKRSEKDPYVIGSIYSPIKNVVNKQGRTFYPNRFPKSRPMDSIVDRNVMLHVTRDNYRTAPTNYTGFHATTNKVQRRASAH